MKSKTECTKNPNTGVSLLLFVMYSWSFVRADSVPGVFLANQISDGFQVLADRVRLDRKGHALLVHWQPGGRLRVCDRMPPVSVAVETKLVWQASGASVWEATAEESGEALWWVSSDERTQCTGVFTQDGQHYPALDTQGGFPKGRISGVAQAFMLRLPEHNFRQQRHDSEEQQNGWLPWFVQSMDLSKTDAPLLSGGGANDFFQQYPPRRPPFPFFSGMEGKEEWLGETLMALLLMAQHYLPFPGLSEQPLVLFDGESSEEPVALFRGDLEWLVQHLGSEDFSEGLEAHLSHTLWLIGPAMDWVQYEAREQKKRGMIRLHGWLLQTREAADKLLALVREKGSVGKQCPATRQGGQKNNGKEAAQSPQTSFGGKKFIELEEFCSKDEDDEEPVKKKNRCINCQTILHGMNSHPGEILCYECKSVRPQHSYLSPPPPYDEEIDFTGDKHLPLLSQTLSEAVLEGDEITVKKLLESGQANANEQNSITGDSVLIVAAANGHLNIVNLLLRHGAKVNYFNLRNNTFALMEAAKKGHKKIVEILLSKGSPVQFYKKKLFGFIKSGSGWSALYEASKEGHEAIVEILINQPDTDFFLLHPVRKNTPLDVAISQKHTGVTRQLVDKYKNIDSTLSMVAEDHKEFVQASLDASQLLIEVASSGNLDEVNTLLSQGAQVKLQNKEGLTALMAASKHGHTAVVAALLARGADVNLQNEDGSTALMEASRYGHTTIVETLLAHGAQVNLQNKFGSTALMISPGYGHTTIIETLLAHGAQVNLQNKFGATALMISSVYGHTATVKTFIEHGAGVNLQNEDGSTALILASRYGYTAIVETLLAHGAEVNLQNKFGATALMISSRYGHTATVKTFIEHGAGVNLQNENGSTALILASRYGYTAIVETLLAHGAEVNLQNKFGWTALMMSSQYGHTAAIEALLAHEAEVNFQCEDGWSALMISSRYGHTAAVETLLAHEAQVNLQNKFGWTALMLASIGNHISIFVTLLKCPETEITKEITKRVDSTILLKTLQIILKEK